MSLQRFYKIWDNIGSCLWSWHGSSPLNHNNHQHIQPFSMLDWSGDSITSRSSLQSKNSQRDDQTSMFTQSSPKCQWLTKFINRHKHRDSWTPIGQHIKKHSGFYKPVHVFDVNTCLQDANTQVFFPSFWQELRQMALRKRLKFLSQLSQAGTAVVLLPSLETMNKRVLWNRY